jgi:hypothetical protein
MQTELSQPIRQPIVRRYFFGMTSHIELACGHRRDERVMWAGSDVAPGEATTCFDCGLVAAGLMPTEAQLQAFRRKHGTE